MGVIHTLYMEDDGGVYIFFESVLGPRLGIKHE